MYYLLIYLLLMNEVKAKCTGFSPCIEIKESYQEQFTARAEIISPSTKVEAEIEEEKEEDTGPGMDIISYAKKFIGIPYLYGGNSDQGMDCSAFIQKVFSAYGLQMPRTSRAQFRHRQLQKVSVDELQSSDLLFFRSQNSQEIDHVALYIGDGKMIHSSSIEQGVQITDFKFSPFWSSRFIGAKRFNKEKI
jgi:cell wall-associated NlpC family hydrolase